MRVSRERKPKGRRRYVRLAGGVMLTLPAGWLAWEASSAPTRGVGMMLLAAGLAIPVGLLVRSWWFRTPFDISIRVPRQLRRRARAEWIDRIFLGWTENWLGIPRWAYGLTEDSVGVVGPPRVNKTAGIGIPQALMWSGSLVSVAPKPQLFRATAARRRLLADRRGGRILIYAPTEQGWVEGLRPLQFSPSSSTDPTEVKLRVDAWVAAAETGRHVENGDHWRAGAARLLRGLFLASAHHRVRPGDFTLVRAWLADRSPGSLAEPIQILRDLRTFAGDQWATELVGIEQTPERERASFFSAAETTIAATGDPTVLRSTTATDFDAERFLLSCSSLYIVSPTEHQQAVAPLISMLIDSIVRTAYRLHREGRLPARLLVSLDDMANCAPLPGLESVISQGGGQGVNVAWNLQSLAQLRDHFSEDAAEAIWSATRCKIVFGGLADEGSLERLSAAIGEERVVAPGQTQTDTGFRSSKHVSWRPILSPSQLREIPNGWALLLYLNERPRMLREPLAAKRFQLWRHMVAWDVVRRELEVTARTAEAQPAGEA